MTEGPAMPRACEEAAEWLFRHDLGLSASDEGDFAAWLAASEDNVTAWERGKATLDAIGLVNDPFLDAMRIDALSARPRSTGAWQFKQAVGSGIAAVVVGAIGFIAWQSMHPTVPGVSPVQTVIALNVPANYSTGQNVRSFTLPDGSEAILDRQTAVAIRFSDRGRELRVLSGQALFDVSHDGRSFRVFGGDTTVTATGTRFAVQLNAESVVATLERGSVSVGRMGTTATVQLLPGQQVVARGGRPFEVRRVSPDAALKWAVTYQSFNDTPLDQAVAMISEHGKAKIRVVGKARQLKITGRFRSDDLLGFLAAVTQALPVRQRHRAGGIIELF